MNGLSLQTRQGIALVRHRVPRLLRKYEKVFQCKINCQHMLTTVYANNMHHRKTLHVTLLYPNRLVKIRRRKSVPDFISHCVTTSLVSDSVQPKLS